MGRAASANSQEEIGTPPGRERRHGLPRFRQIATEDFQVLPRLNMLWIEGKDVTQRLLGRPHVSAFLQQDVPENDAWPHIARLTGNDRFQNATGHRVLAAAQVQPGPPNLRRGWILA